MSSDPGLPPDAELVEGIRSGDTRTLERLMEAYWGSLVQYADRILGEGSDPQDVVQEAFIRLWTHRDRWGAEGSVRALLLTLTRHAALDERRRRTRSARVAEAADPPAAPAPPSADASADELRRAASRAVAELPPKRREVFRLSRDEGLSYAEIAKVTGLSPQTVANHMSLALNDLRTALAVHLDAPSAVESTSGGEPI